MSHRSSPILNNFQPDYNIKPSSPASTDRPQITNIQQVTPELAAQVIKDFILPMFETDGRKLIRQRQK